MVEELVSADDAPGELRRLTSTPSTAELLRRSASDGGSSGSDSNGSGANGGSGGSNGSSTSTGVGARVQRLARAGVAVARALLFLAARLLLSALAPLLTLLLRRLVRDRRFWERGLRSAWHDGQKVTREYVDAYRYGGSAEAGDAGWELGSWAGKLAGPAGRNGQPLPLLQCIGPISLPPTSRPGLPSPLPLRALQPHPATRNPGLLQVRSAGARLGERNPAVPGRSL